MRLPPLALLSVLALLGVLVPAAPAAATWTCQSLVVGVVCVGEYDGYNGCAEDGSIESSFTGVIVGTPAGSASAGGYETCVNWCFGEFCISGYGKGVSANAATIAGSATVSWFVGPGGTCHTTVTTFTPANGYQATDLGCPAGPPPNEDWGNVLP